LALFVIFLTLSSGCVGKKAQDLQGKTILMVIAPTNYRDEELSIPKEMFEDYGAKVVIASNVDVARGIKSTVAVDVDVSAVDISKFDAIVFVGGPGVETHRLYEDDTYLSLARDAYAEDKIVAAICFAPKILANAGLLEGRNATIWYTEAAYLTSKGAHYTGDDVTVDGLLITANGPSASRWFAEKIIRVLS